MTPEGVVKDDIKDGLEAYPMPYFMPVQTGYGKRDIDFRCTLPPYGTSLLIEAKRADYKGKLTTIQKNTLIANAKAGGLSVCALCWEDVKDAIVRWRSSLRANDGLFINYNFKSGPEARRY